VFLRPGGLRAIEHALGGYREPIPVPIDEFRFLGRISLFVLYLMLSVLSFLFLFVPHSEFRPALHGVQGSPAHMGFKALP
jgi:hypothetical protein